MGVTASERTENGRKFDVKGPSSRGSLHTLSLRYLFAVLFVSKAGSSDFLTADCYLVRPHLRITLAPRVRHLLQCRFSNGAALSHLQRSGSVASPTGGPVTCPTERAARTSTSDRASHGADDGWRRLRGVIPPASFPLERHPACVIPLWSVIPPTERDSAYGASFRLIECHPAYGASFQLRGVNPPLGRHPALERHSAYGAPSYPRYPAHGASSRLIERHPVHGALFRI